VKPILLERRIPGDFKSYADVDVWYADFYFRNKPDFIIESSN